MSRVLKSNLFELLIISVIDLFCPWLAALQYRILTLFVVFVLDWHDTRLRAFTHATLCYDCFCKAAIFEHYITTMNLDNES